MASKASAKEKVKAYKKFVYKYDAISLNKLGMDSKHHKLDKDGNITSTEKEKVRRRA